MKEIENSESNKRSLERKKNIGKEVGAGRVGLSDMDKGAGRKQSVRK